MRLIVIVFFLFNTAILFAQRDIDTVYLNNNFEKIRKSKAVYYRCIAKDSATNLYRIMDYRKTGELYRMGRYKDKAAANPSGIVTIFYQNGRIKHEAAYVDGALAGIVKSFYNNGGLMRVEKYDNYKLITGKYFTSDGKDTILTPYYQYPSFKAGDAELKKFIGDNMIYPIEAEVRGLEGIVRVGLLVNKDGTIEKIGVLSSTNDIFNKAAVKVIELTRHKWNAGFDEGEPADIAISVPVVFKIK